MLMIEASQGEICGGCDQKSDWILTSEHDQIVVCDSDLPTLLHLTFSTIPQEMGS